MDEGGYAINIICEQELGNTLWKLRTTQCSIYDVSDAVVILTSRQLYIMELVIHTTVPLQLPQHAVLCSASSVVLRSESCCTNPLAQGQTQLPHCKGAG